MRRGPVLLLVLLVAAACGDDDAATTTTTDREAAVAQYCAVLEGATTRGSAETMRMLDAVALPEVADLIDRMRRFESSGQDPLDLAAFNDATCGVRFP
jgi:hypothetical protein